MPEIFTITVDGGALTLTLSFAMVALFFVLSLLISWAIGKVFTEQNNPLLKNVTWKAPNSSLGACVWMISIAVGSLVTALILVWGIAPLIGKLLAVFMPEHATIFYALCLLVLPVIIFVSNTAFYILYSAIKNTVDNG